MGAARRCRNTSAVSDQARSEDIRSVKSCDIAFDGALQPERGGDGHRQPGRKSKGVECAFEIDGENPGRQRLAATRWSERALFVARHATLGPRPQLALAHAGPRRAD